MSATRQPTPAEQAILDLIASHNALIAIVFDTQYSDAIPVINYTEIYNHYLHQLADPNQYRPSRSVNFFGKEEICNYDIELLSLPGATPLGATAKTAAQTENRPILIKRSDDAYSVYGFDYYREEKWQETPIKNIEDVDLPLLQRTPFDGRFLKPADAYAAENKAETTIPAYGIRRLYRIIAQNHTYLPRTVNKLNMKTGQIHQHKPGQDRFTKNKDKTFTHTAKMSTSLIPPDPRYMELYHCDEGIGFLWDINECNLKKEKYVFQRNAGTNSCFWLDLSPGFGYGYQSSQIRYLSAEEKLAATQDTLKYNPVVSVASLRESNLAAIRDNNPIFWNELVVGLPKGIIRAAFAPQDVRNVRLRTLKAMWEAKKALNLSEDLPLFILQPFYAKEYKDDLIPKRPAVYRIYSQEEQQADLLADREDKAVEETMTAIMRNQHALAVTVADHKAVDQLLEQTTKVDAALLPVEPQWMRLTANDNESLVGLLWDSEACQLDDAARAMLPTLRAQNHKAVEQQRIIDRNAVPVSLSKDKINGVFCYLHGNDDLFNYRIKAQNLALYVKEKLQLTTNLPIYLIYPEDRCFHYTDLMQVMDQNELRQRQTWPQPTPATLRLQRGQPFFKAMKQPGATGFFGRSAMTMPTSQNDADWVQISSNDLPAETTQQDVKIPFSCTIM